MEVLANPWKGKQVKPDKLLTSSQPGPHQQAAVKDGTEALSKIVANKINQQQAGGAGAVVPGLPPGAVVQPHGHPRRSPPPDRPGLIPITIPVPVSCVDGYSSGNNNLSTNFGLNKGPESEGVVKTKFMFAVALSMEQTEDATGTTRETFALTTTLKESFRNFLPSMPFGGSSSSPAPIEHKPSSKSKQRRSHSLPTPPSKKAIKYDSCSKNKNNDDCCSEPISSSKYKRVKSQNEQGRTREGRTDNKDYWKEEFKLRQPKVKKTPVVVEACKKVVMSSHDANDAYSYDEALKNVPLLEPFAVSQGDPFHFQILGMQDALMDITEEIGRIFHRERLAAKIIHAPDSATRASLIARMGPENRVELIRMAKSLQLFRWLLIQILVTKYKDRGKPGARVTEKYEVTSLAQWFKMASISESLIGHCGNKRDCYSSQLDALLKFVDGKLGNRKVNPRLQHPTQSLATKGVPKIGLISSGTLQKNTVLEQINRGTVKGGSSLVVMRRAGGAQSPTRSPTQPSRRFGLPLRTPPDTGPSIARRIEKLHSSCRENDQPPVTSTPSPAEAVVVKQTSKKNEASSDSKASDQQQSSSQAAYMEELQLAVKMRAARIDASQTSCCMDAGDNAAACCTTSTVPSLPDVPSII